MPQYYYKKNHIKSQKRWSRAKKLVTSLILILLFLGVGAGVYIWQSSQGTDKPVAIQAPTQTYYQGAPQRLIDNDRFSFKSTSQWQFSRAESPNSSRFVFFKQINNLIAYELDILFDKSAADKPVNYIMPVTIVNGKLKTEPMSDRCGNKTVAQSSGTNLPGTLTETYKGVTYVCAVLGSNETAAAGLVGGSYNIPLKTSKGEPTVVNFVFINSTSGAFEQTFKEILESFQLK